MPSKIKVGWSHSATYTESRKFVSRLHYHVLLLSHVINGHISRIDVGQKFNCIHTFIGGRDQFYNSKYRRYNNAIYSLILPRN